MKKLVLAFAAVVAMSFASCGNNTEATESTVDSDSIAAAEAAAAEVVDTLAADTLAADSL